MTDLKNDIESVFGCTELPHALFYEFEFALRFELGGEGVSPRRPIKRFIQAFERADAVAAELFARSSVWLLSSVYGEASPPKKHLKPFKTIGLSRSDFTYLGAVAQIDTDHIEDFGGQLYRHWASTLLDNPDLIKEALWLALGSDIGIRPTAHSSLYFVDFENQTVLHPYDDRGMDVIATRKEALSYLYRSRHSLDLSRFSAAPSARLGHFPLEGDRAFPT